MRDGETGVLRAPGDIGGMAAAAAGILGDQARWQTMSDRAAEDARARFAEDAIVPLYEALYAKAVRDRPRPATAGSAAR